MTQYDVVWANRYSGKIRKTRVRLDNGYSAEHDIPRIIAIRYMTARDEDMVQVLEKHRVLIES